ncbi:MAG: AmmeMemoRadiSam system protein B [Promethearchaeota archaeon]|nr:MAG: AmmeMemoRadiSam system protein B [Candidatus Lokiarchaeota archaeon]
MEKRKATNAGGFYPRFKKDLVNKIETSFRDENFGPGMLSKSEKREKRTILGGVSPHAGYDYSGCAAAYTYYNLFRERIPDTVIILGTDHLGYSKVGLMKEGSWETPLGDLQIDGEVAKEILQQSDIIIEDNSAFNGFPFGREHNIEVQLPFIKYCAQDQNTHIVPIKVGLRTYQKLPTIAKSIANALKNLQKDIVIVASSDMTHQKPKDSSNPAPDIKQMKEKDQAVIDAFVQLDPEKTFKNAKKTTVCGAQTITTLLLTIKELGATEGKALKYYTSYDKVSGGSGYCDYSVGYFSGILLK